MSHFHKWLFLSFLLAAPAGAACLCPGVPTPVDSSWSLIFDEEFNAGSAATPADYTHINDVDNQGHTRPSPGVWNVFSGVGSGSIGTCPSGVDCNLKGGPYCQFAHGVTLHGHEIDLEDKSGCWVSGSTQPGEGARIGSGPTDTHVTWDCSSSGVISISGVTQPGFCFTPGTGTGEIYAENLYDVPCSGANLQNHISFWTVGNGLWAATGEFDISQPFNTTQQAGEVWHGQFPNQSVAFGTSYAACGWHVFGAHWIGGSSPTIEFLVDGVSEGKITANVTSAPQMVLLEYLYDGTPTTSSANATAKSIYIHIYGKNVTYPAVTPQANYGGPGDKDGKTLGTQ